MKKNKKGIITVLIILLILVALGLIIYNFYKGYKDDKAKTNELINNINNGYNDFVAGLNDINNKRETVYTNIFKETYYTDMQNNIDSWNTTIDEYSKTIESLDNKSKYLKDNCLNIKFYHSEINPKCDLFVENYEMVINYYITDIEIYNKNIDSYNTWANENDEDSYKIIDKFVNNSYTEYIDFNNDGVFLGKE